MSDNKDISKVCYRVFGLIGVFGVLAFSSLINKLDNAFVLRSLSFFCCSAIGLVRISDVDIDATILHRLIGSRSPPIFKLLNS